MNHKIDEILDDYTRTPVPQNETLSGIRVAVIIIGVFITLPVFWLGADITQKIGTVNMLWSTAIVSIFLGVLSYLTGLVGSRSRLSTYMIMHFSFGRHGAKVVNIIMAITLLGFFSATLEIFGSSIDSAIDSVFAVQTGTSIHIIWGGIIMTLTTIFGVKALDKLSMVTVPLMALFMGYLILLTINKVDAESLISFSGSDPHTVNASIAGIIGMAIMTAGLMPDFSRFCRDDKATLITALSVAIGYPFVMISGGLPSIITGETEIMPIMLSLGLALPAILILVFSTWTTNTANLYANTLTTATFLPVKDWKLTTAAGTLATAVALLGFMQYFFDMLIALSITVPPLAAIYLIDFFSIRKQNFDVSELASLPAFGWPALASWAIACVIAWGSTYGGLNLSTLPSVDSMLAAALLYYAFNKLFCHSKKCVAIKP